MERSGNEKEGLAGALARIAAFCLLVTAACVCFLEGRSIYGPATTASHSGVAYAQTSEEAASARAFLAASRVLFHPRCVNCHPAGDAPLQGDEIRPHAMQVRRGPEGFGKNPMECGSCHQAENLPGAHMPPGAPGWEMPPEDMPMVFEKHTPRELCLQLRDPAQNGNRTPKEVVDHVRTALLVLWGWQPGDGRTPVPMPHEEFVRLMTEWAEKGAACPE